MGIIQKTKAMKNAYLTIFPLVLGLLSPSLLWGQDALSQNYSDYMERSGYKVVYVTKRMFALAAQVAAGANDKELEEAIGKIQGLKSLSSHESGRASYSDWESRIPRSFEELMIVREKGERTGFWVKTNAKDQIEELLMLQEDRQEIVLISIYGLIDLKQLARLAKQMDIGGLDKLEDFDEN